MELVIGTLFYPSLTTAIWSSMEQDKTPYNNSTFIPRLLVRGLKSEVHRSVEAKPTPTVQRSKFIESKPGFLKLLVQSTPINFLGASKPPTICISNIAYTIP